MFTTVDSEFGDYTVGREGTSVFSHHLRTATGQRGSLHSVRSVAQREELSVSVASTEPRRLRSRSCPGVGGVPALQSLTR